MCWNALATGLLARSDPYDQATRLGSLANALEWLLELVNLQSSVSLKMVVGPIPTTG